MIELTLKQVADVWEPLKRFTLYDWPASYAFDILQISRKVREVRRDYEDSLEKLYKRYGTPEGGGYRIGPEAQADFSRELGELNKKVVRIEAQKLSMNAIRINAPKDGIAPGVLMDLEPIILDDIPKG